MIIEVVFDVLGTVARFVGRFVLTILGEFVFERLIHGTGYTLLRIARPRAKPGEVESFIVGLLFWAFGVYWLFRYFSAP